MLKTYYQLVKPGIIYGNSLNVAAGFLLAAGMRRQYDLRILAAVLAGSALVIAAGCVYNNYLDRGIDRRMKRTKGRALVTGSVSAPAALAYATVLLAAGFGTLAAWTNMTTMAVGAIGFVFYVALYGLAKRKTVYGTLVGSVSGAIPPVAGYTAVAGQLDGGAGVLFAIVTAWQMPHFYAIAIYRFKDYAAAGLPVWPVAKGVASAKKQIIFWTLAFGVAAVSPTLLGYTGYLYFAGAALLSCIWFFKALQGQHPTNTPQDDARWARHIFFFSLVVTLAIDCLLAVGPLLP